MSITAFGRYEVEGEIGDGGMGRVYRGVDPLFRRAVAIKTIKTEYLTHATRDEYLRRFRSEAIASGRLSHPNIVSVYDVGENYIVMEFVEGVTLAALLKERRLTLPEALDLLSPLADALDHAHRAGVLHRDVKPVNIMIQPDGQPKLMDFGIARLDTSIITVPGQFLGSPAYLSPEQIRGDEATFRADHFSFAVVAYEVLTGHRAFEGNEVSAVLYKVVYAKAPTPCSRKPDLPETYNKIFARALAKTPEHRFPSARALVAALRGESRIPWVSTTAGSDQTWRNPVDTQPVRSILRRRRRRVLPIAVTTLVILAGALAALQTTHRRDEVKAGLGTGTLRIETVPEGAAVWLDGDPVGKAPVELRDLRPGPRHLRILEDGYSPAELGLELGEGMKPPPLRFVMSPTAAPLAVTSEPAGARVRLDGRQIGMTPVGKVLVPPGWHEVAVDRPGFQGDSRRLEASAGEPLLVSVRLMPIAVTKPRVVRVAALKPRPSLPLPPPSPPPTPPPLAEGALVEIDGSVTAPIRISGAPAPYPEKARKLKLRGSVLLDMIITERGEPTEVRVVESAGVVLDEAVEESIRQWRFSPARKDGVKVRVHWQCRQTFQLGS